MAAAWQGLIEELDTAVRDADQAAFKAAADRCVGNADRCVGNAVGPFKLLQAAISARNAGFGEGSEYLLRRMIAHLNPVPKSVYVELAFQQRLKGNFNEAVSLLLVAMRVAGSDFRTALFTAHMLYASARKEDGDAMLAGCSPTSVQEQQNMMAMRQFGRFLQAYPLSRALELLSELKARHVWSEHFAYGAAICKAQEKGEAFSLIRLGDGEGACMRLGATDEADYPQLYEANRQNRIAMWFGADFPWATNGFTESWLGLRSGIEEADLLAIPDVDWLRKAYRISSLSGVTSLVNVLRMILSRDNTAKRLQLCSATAHFELYEHGYIERLVRAAKRVSVITCLPDLPSAMRTRFDLDEVTLLQIPGEVGSAKTLGDTVDFGVHYPTAYHQMMSKLAHPNDGRVFLIAGGFLGKLYTAEIKRRGGLALDVGSLVDSWMGKKTRPTYEPRFRLGI